MVDWRERDLDTNADTPMPRWLIRQLQWWRYGSLAAGLIGWASFVAPLIWIGLTSPEAKFFTAYGMVQGPFQHAYDEALYGIGVTVALLSGAAGIILAVLGHRALGSKSPPTIYIGFALSFAVILANIFLSGGHRA